MTTKVLCVSAGLASFLAVVHPAAAQPSPLTLEQAIDLAVARSASMDIAVAREARADADLLRVRSLNRPQLALTGTYTRTLASEFSGAFEPTGPFCDPLAVDPARALTDRVSELERAASCGAIGPDFNFGTLPFGQRNIYQLGLSFSQSLYSGGRVAAERAQADLSRRAASLVTLGAEAQLALDVTRAFYDAALSDRLVAITELGFDQADAAFAHVRLAFDTGRQPEFEVLRAEVARDNQRPAVIRSRVNRDVAYLRLRQLLELPSDAPLVLAVDLDTEDLEPPAPFAAALGEALAAGSAAARNAVEQADVLVGIREAAVTAARAERLPSVDLTSSFGRVGYASDGMFPGTGDFRTNWSLSATLQVPLLTGGRLRADELGAHAHLAEAQAQFRQTRELAALDAASALRDLAAAEAALEASAGTVEQAERAYQIAELRNQEGLSTQLELSDSRLSWQVAQANRAQAARDLQIARVRAALLPNLPLVAP